MRRSGDREEDDDPPMVKLVNRLVEDAYARGVSEIHGEALRDAARILHLRAGALEERMRLPKQAYPSLVNRLKVMAGLSPFPTSRRGRIRFREFSRWKLDVDLELSFAPEDEGERVLVRIQLPGVEPDDACPYARLVRRLLEDAAREGASELRWEPGDPARVEWVLAGRAEERLRLPAEALAEHLRVLGELADDESGRIRLESPTAASAFELHAGAERARVTVVSAASDRAS